jgi:hypothetical protein
MYNAVPKRTVSLEEAKSHGWPHFWDGKTECTQGHIAARYVSNPYRCIECARIADGKLPIYGSNPHADLIGEAVAGPNYTDPALRTDFRWNDENWRQFCVAYINTNDAIEALKLVKAQPYDLINILRTDPQREAEFAAARADADQVFLWKAEGSAATGSDRAMLARAGATFPDRFGSRGQSGLSAEPYVNPDKAVAELAKLLSSARGSLAERSALGAARSVDKKVAEPDTSPTNDAGGDVEEAILLGSSHDDCDLI